MGRVRPAEAPAAGDLCPIEALDREGLAVTSEGALVRVLRAAPKNPLVMSAPEREQVGHALGQLAGRLPAGQSLQFYVEATPVGLDALLERSETDAHQAIQAQGCDGERPGAAAPARRDARVDGAPRRRAGRGRARLLRDRPLPARPAAPGGLAAPAARRLRPAGTAALERSLAAHRRVARESLHLTDAIRADLEALDLSTHLLDGSEVLDLLWRRFNPTTADRTPDRRPGAREQRLEILGELDATAGAQEAARAARALRELVAASGIDWPDQRHLRVDRDLEQALYVATLPDATEFGWLLEAMQIPRAFTLSVHVHALDRLRERSRFKNRHRRLFGVRRRAARPHAGLRDARPGGRARRAAH